ncbi:MAG TPA: SGNH/GDSL hydrolase family protein [Sphingomonas sp.]
MSHVVLLGDSILDNQAYVGSAPDVSQQLRAHLGANWAVTLLAVDGHVTADVRRHQLDRVPEGASYLVISVGGNDALGHASILGERASSVAEAVGRLADAQARFAADYAQMIGAVLALGLPTVVCTIYDANYPEPQRRLVVAALALFNDVIARAAFSCGLPLIDLRLICTEAADYANPIEPSAIGGDKIAGTIAALVQNDRSGRVVSAVWH